MEKYVVVIGAANVDIGGSPYENLIKYDSNPGHINISFGGVGRNIAENMCKLGLNVKLIAACGNDPLGRELIKYCNNCGIDTSHVIIDDDHNTSMYIYINNRKGDMTIALSDVDIAESVTPEYIDSVENIINNAEAVVMDCNISEKTYLHIKEICKVPLYVDPVSQSHASKIKNDLRGITVIKPNKMEAEYLTGIKLDSESDYVDAADYFFSKGIEKVFISMGSRGMVAAEKNNYYIVESYPAEVISTTGAGDSATAAIIWSMMDHDEESDIIRAARSANAAAALTVNSDKTINPELSQEKVIEILSHEDIIKIRKI